MLYNFWSIARDHARFELCMKIIFVYLAARVCRQKSTSSRVVIVDLCCIVTIKATQPKRDQLRYIFRGEATLVHRSQYNNVAILNTAYLFLDLYT